MALITLKEYCKRTGTNYRTAWDWHNGGKLPTFRGAKGSILIEHGETPKAESKAMIPKGALPFGNVPMQEATATVRRNASSTIERTDRFSNISNSLTPFTRIHYGMSGTSLYSVRDAIILCQKAYYNISAVRNAIEIMVAFSNSELFWEGGSKRSREFFKSLWENLNIWKIKDQFFRECYRSGNCCIYRYDTKVDDEDALRIVKLMGLQKAKAEVMLPVQYAFLHPAEIVVGDGLSYLTSTYYRKLEGSALARLKNPATEEDRQVLALMPPDVRKQVKAGGTVLQPLDAAKFIPVFYQKQDYEPFAVPMVYGLLDQLEYRIELEKMDAAIARTWQQIVLLVTTGAPPDEGGINPDNIAALQSIFQNQSIGRVLVADHTTKVEWKIPQIADILDPKKYSVIDEYIKEGLGNVLTGSEKFANTSIKTRVFVERLQQARKLFLNDFLVPEVKRIAGEMGFRDHPVPRFSEIDLQDANQYNRIYTRLVEIGAITPDDGIRAINTGKLPTPQENLESQMEFKELKDKGLFQPIQSKQKEEGGRPVGSGGPQTKEREISPIGTQAKYGIGAVVKNLGILSKLRREVESHLAKGKKGSVDSETVVSSVMAAEKPESWLAKARDYCSGKAKANPSSLEPIFRIMENHQTDFHTAAVLFHSQVQEDCN